MVSTKIGIIGAGAAGLAALRHSVKQGHDCIAFEQTDNIGGTWNYRDLTTVDKYGLPVHSSMYEGLMTNLPKELMEFEDFHYQIVDRSYIDQLTVLKYLEQFAENHKLHQHIKLLRHVIEVDPLPSQKWRLKEKNLQTSEITEHIFDVVLVCIGNYSVPLLPEIPGMDLLVDNAIHSHYYRKPDEYNGRKVLVIGAGPSGIDIARIVSKVSEKIYISYRDSLFRETEECIIRKPLVKRFEKGKAIFVDGSTAEIDNVIYCTGYQYCYPFLTPACDIMIENNWIKYLYKHIVNVAHPTMGFIGVPFKVCPFPMFDIQARFFLEFIKNITKFSKKKMIDDILEDVDRRAVLTHQVHRIGMTHHRSYFDDLANTLNINKIAPVIHKLYEHINIYGNSGKRYIILNDKEFMKLD